MNKKNFPNPKGNSIGTRLHASYIIIVCILLIPVIITMFLTRLYAARYHLLIDNVNQISSLVPVIRSDIYDELWREVSGLTPHEEGKQYELIARINMTIDTILKTQGNAKTRKELVVAKRTMGTLTTYVDRLAQQMKEGYAVKENEKILDEVRGVSMLVVDMLQEFIVVEISDMHITNQWLSSAVSISILVEIILVLLAIFTAARAHQSLSNFIRKPISRLEDFAATIAGGNLLARAPETKVAELHELTVSMNVMADKLQTLISENQHEQENLKKAELRTLQAQVTPHFLYNTLDAIIWLAQAHKSDEVIRITQALSSFYRISLSQGRDFITVHQEMQHIEGYLMIQKIRYRDILDYSINIDPEICDDKILKLLLQPLVENAIYHGIKNRRSKGTLQIHGIKDGGFLCFHVQDNGLGMARDRLEQVRESLAGLHSEDTDFFGYGLYNVNKRIKLYYNQLEGLTIQSDEASGTIVSFCVPIRSDDIV